MNDKVPIARQAVFGEVDTGNPRKRRVTFRDVAVLYGQRPNDDSVWYLSPYEFVTYWEPVLLNCPLQHPSNPRETYHATLTSSGQAKVSRQSQQKEDAEELMPGVDYTVDNGVRDE